MMRRAFLLVCVLAGNLVLSACGASEPVVVDGFPEDSSVPTTETSPGTGTPSPDLIPLSEIGLGFELIADGFSQPLFVTGAGDGSGRLFVVEKTGRVMIVREGKRLEQPLLDLSGAVSTESERGLLGLAFPPDFLGTGVFYVDYTDRNGDTVVSRLAASGDSARQDSEEILLRIAQPYSNHNGGMLAFGPDGYLYIGTGDGGSGGDPQSNGQSLDTLLGKLLRIDVSTRAAQARYGIPSDNPFIDRSGARPEIWALGLRNPWRFSFDRETGDLWIGDVGQNEYEEINLQPAGSVGGENYGWNLYEGTHRFRAGPNTPTAGLMMPVIEYDHSAGRSVTGGYVYRGESIRGLAGAYVYGDFASGRVWGVRGTRSRKESREFDDTAFAISSFGEDDEGELYLTDLSGGAVYRIVSK